MRRLLALFLIALLPAVSAVAIPVSSGKIVRGKYYASGRASVAGIQVRYLPSSVHITGNGRIKGFVARLVTSRTGQTLESGYVRIRGRVRQIRTRHGAFTASTVIHTGDGAKISGTFHGLVDPAQRLSRYFKGKISGSTNSSFKLQAR